MSKARYERAMTITDPDEALQCFTELVGEFMQACPHATLDEAEKAVSDDLAYYAGYYDNETRARVEALFECEHPYFGAIAKNGPPTNQEAWAMGVAIGRAMRGDSDDDT